MQKVVAVCGVKNSGKTTLLTKLVSAYSSKGLKVAVIKHDGHDFACDIPGTDTFRFTESGAYGTAYFSDKRMFIHRVGTGETERELLGCFPEADIIFIEGRKDSEYRKIEVIRSGISDIPASNPKGRFLIVTDLPAEHFDEKTANIDDIPAIMKSIDEVEA
ncbi:MAG: molybdopterin-guanine dinucleotide biosynthesis protein B [Mogibacterium sp.]|nr:molybdopterin-guanine dinucleotide biosynthesis protein B [Mogibacterium sp.]